MCLKARANWIGIKCYFECLLDTYEFVVRNLFEVPIFYRRTIDILS